MKGAEMKIPTNVKAILDRLLASGFDAYVVGGSLRDALLGKEAHDWDVTSSARPEEVIALFSDMRVIPTGLKHGTVTVMSEGDPIEITTFRTDGKYSDSRHPESVTFAARVEDDLSRRDFTVNAMAYNESRGLVDLFGGRDDLASRTIRCVGDPEKRFSEDALRIMRAFRFSSQLDFDIHPETLDGAIRMREGLKNIARERIGSEFLRLLCGASPEKALSKMDKILEFVIDKTIDTQRFAWLSSIECDAISRLALLLCGSSENELIAASHSLRLSSKQKGRLIKLAFPPSADELTDLTPVGARRIIARYGEDSVAAASISVALYGADAVSLDVLRRVEAENPCVAISQLAVDGSDLISENIAKGKQVGEVLSRLLDAVIEDPSLNTRESLINLAKDWKIQPTVE